MINAPLLLRATLPEEVGYITAVRFEPQHTIDDLYWHYSGDVVLLGRAVRFIAESLPEEGPMTALLVDRVWIHEDHRGQGYGTTFLSRVLDAFKSDCRYAALIPCPFDRPGTVEEQLAGRRALAKLWESIGFEHFAGEIWVKDLR